MRQTVWIDVEDLVAYAHAAPRPSGIQRVQYELCRSLAALPSPTLDICFVRHDVPRQCFEPVGWADIDAIFARLTSQDTTPDAEASTAVPAERAGTNRPSLMRRVRSRMQRLPPRIAAPLQLFCIYQLEALRGLAALASQTLAWIRSGAAATAPVERVRDVGCAVTLDAAQPSLRGLDRATPGDILVTLGVPWADDGFVELIARARRERGMRFALFVHDLIPLIHPEWCHQTVIPGFRAWIEGALPLADTVLATSRCTATDILRHVQSHGLLLRAVPVVVPLGSGFHTTTWSGREPTRVLPAAGSYVLIVSTIEARKNHALLFRVWRRLLDEMPTERVPTLVFAGRVAWLVDDLLQQIANTGNLNGKLVHIADASDRELAELYRGCRFTLFPSLYEGWGLPVTEGLFFGRPGFVSNTSSLPEAGGALARYFDPDNAPELLRLIRHAIEQPEDLAAWQCRIVRDFRPVSWDETARAVMQALQAPQRLVPVRSGPLQGGRTALT